jgi:hypothetical protein
VVDKVVEEGTTDEGPLYPGCPGTSVYLEAKPNPSYASFPAGEPHWTVQGPFGTCPYFSEDTGPTTRLFPGYKWGDYIVTAKCGSNDPGDSITVKFNLVNEIPWGIYTPTWGTTPFSCIPPCDGEDSYEMDDCGNKLEYSCCEEDGSGGTDCALRVFYNGILLSSCVFHYSPDNYVARKIATIEGTNLKYITKIRHENIETNKDGGGCPGFYCSKFYEYDCITGFGYPVWRRDPDYPPQSETDGTDDCPGHD